MSLVDSVGKEIRVQLHEAETGNPTDHHFLSELDEHLLSERKLGVE